VALKAGFDLAVDLEEKPSAGLRTRAGPHLLAEADFDSGLPRRQEAHLKAIIIQTSEWRHDIQSDDLP